MTQHDVIRAFSIKTFIVLVVGLDFVLVETLHAVETNTERERPHVSETDSQTR